MQSHASMYISLVHNVFGHAIQHLQTSSQLYIKGHSPAVWCSTCPHRLSGLHQEASGHTNRLLKVTASSPLQAASLAPAAHSFEASSGTARARKLDSFLETDSSKESMQLAPRVGAGTTAARTSVVQRGFLQTVFDKIRPGKAASPPPAEPAVQELGPEQLRDALKYGMLASAAYSDDEEKVRAKLQAFRGGEIGHAPFKIVKQTGTLWKTPLTGRQVSTDTEVLCLRLQSASGFEDEMVVAFRGTETDGSGAASDILTDMYALQAHIGNMEGVPAEKYSQDVMVHRGFLASFNDVVQPTASGRYDALREARDELMGKGVLPARVVVTGHSLGAALATLGAFWLKTIMPSVTVECWAFASPRVGNKEFAEVFSSTVDKCYRLTHKNDIVPAVPASHFWVHVQQPVLLLEPARNTYGHNIPTAMPPGSRYRAILGDRPRPGAYASVGDHDMGLYLAALEDALKALEAHDSMLAS